VQSAAWPWTRYPTIVASINIRENVPLAPFTTFKIGGLARNFAEITAESQLREALAYAEAQSLPVFVLGGGSNLLVPDEGYRGLVLHIQITGLTQSAAGVFAVGAGVPWEDFVDAALAANCAGIECLAGIPGSTGGTPVQNVGAYGQEVAETIAEVRAYDRRTSAIVDLPAASCNFRYRASLFNTDERNRYIVTRVTFKLRPGDAPTLKYADLQRHFAPHSVAGENAAAAPTLQEVAAAVRQIRRAKGMLIDADHDDANTRSAGSYFKNPIVPASVLDALAAAADVPSDNVPHWPADQATNGKAATGRELMKLPAAWLLEHAGFVKGYGIGAVGISTLHTLALVNRGHASFADLQRMEAEIVAGVQRKFAITLEREPVLLA
jgi:UDP-N-acetylmuramate dehydrogenase